jgi:hypothetical protein
MKGFFKNSFGWCQGCVPPCSYCERVIARWNGEQMHPVCARRKREGLPPPKPKSRPRRATESLPDRPEAIPVNKFTPIST